MKIGIFNQVDNNWIANSIVYQISELWKIYPDINSCAKSVILSTLDVCGWAVYFPPNENKYIKIFMISNDNLESEYLNGHLNHINQKHSPEFIEEDEKNVYTFSIEVAIEAFTLEEAKEEMQSYLENNVFIGENVGDWTVNEN